MTKARSVAFFGIFTALAIIAGYIERITPSPVPMIPGIKLGIANVIILMILYTQGAKAALGINVARILASGILFSGPSGVLYALAGGLLSFAAMLLGKKTGALGVAGVSVLGGVFHNTGQIAVAAAVVWNMRLFYYLPVLIIAGIVTGVITGLIAGYSLNPIRKLQI